MPLLYPSKKIQRLLYERMCHSGCFYTNFDGALAWNWWWHQRSCLMKLYQGATISVVPGASAAPVPYEKGQDRVRVVLHERRLYTHTGDLLSEVTITHFHRNVIITPQIRRHFENVLPFKRKLRLLLDA